jgi:hypothetical protein
MFVVHFLSLFLFFFSMALLCTHAIGNAVEYKIIGVSSRFARKLDSVSFSSSSSSFSSDDEMDVLTSFSRDSSNGTKNDDDNSNVTSVSRTGRSISSSERKKGVRSGSSSNSISTSETGRSISKSTKKDVRSSSKSIKSEKKRSPTTSPSPSMSPTIHDSSQQQEDFLLDPTADENRNGDSRGPGVYSASTRGLGAALGFVFAILATGMIIQYHNQLSSELLS